VTRPRLLRDAESTLSLMETAAELRMSRDVAYKMAREGRFPVRLLRVGRQYRVSVADLRQYLGLPAEPSVTAGTGAA
jgi:excisionase family DNA binding protein